MTLTMMRRKTEPRNPAAEPVRVERQELPGYTREIPIYRKECAKCGTSFEGTAKSRYCSPKCRTAHWEELHPESNRQRQARHYRAKKQQPPGG